MTSESERRLLLVCLAVGAACSIALLVLLVALFVVYPVQAVLVSGVLVGLAGALSLVQAVWEELQL